jgi:RimJ/RimL family protein N-acetyltransferase
MAVSTVVLETPRLLLRPPLGEDFDAWAAMAADPISMATLGGVQPRAVAWRALVQMAGSWSLYGFGMFSVYEQATGLWIGRVGPWRPDGWPGNEIGWGLCSFAHGRGYATEAAAAAIDWAIDALGWNEFIHCIDPSNHRSIMVAERLGSRRLRCAELPAPSGQRIDVYGQTAAEWRQCRDQRDLPR